MPANRLYRAGIWVAAGPERDSSIAALMRWRSESALCTQAVAPAQRLQIRRQQTLQIDLLFTHFARRAARSLSWSSPILPTLKYSAVRVANVEPAHAGGGRHGQTFRQLTSRSRRTATAQTCRASRCGPGRPGSPAQGECLCIFRQSCSSWRQGFCWVRSPTGQCAHGGAGTRQTPRPGGQPIALSMMLE